LGRDYFDDVVAAHIYPQAVDEMQEHKDQGRLVVVATTNMRHLVENVARYAPVDHVIGAELEARDGRLTGRVTGPTWGEEKAVAVRAWAHENDVSLPRSHAYSDHFSDHPFLALVGNPHVVNGDRRLRRMARRKRWPMHRFAHAKRTRA
jgi:HAD superfamily hydrolase (TIGR01490 family)